MTAGAYSRQWRMRRKGLLRTLCVADTLQAAAEQRRRLTAACLIVLITFPARAAFDLLQAYAKFNDEINIACGPCDAC